VPRTKVVFYQHSNGRVPLLEWLDSLTPKGLAKCRAKIEWLQNLGYEIRRPEADYLQDGIYELRIRLEGINYRMLYLFCGNNAVVMSHGLKKERVVPPSEIDRARECKKKFERDPKVHTYQEK